MPLFRNMDDVRVWAQGIENRLNNFLTNDIDLHQRRIRNASPSEKPDDYVTRGEFTGFPSEKPSSGTNSSTALGSTATTVDDTIAKLNQPQFFTGLQQFRDGGFSQLRFKAPFLAINTNHGTTPDGGQWQWQSDSSVTLSLYDASGVEVLRFTDIGGGHLDFEVFGNLTFAIDATYDIGGVNNNRPRDGNFNGTIRTIGEHDTTIPNPGAPAIEFFYDPIGDAGWLRAYNYTGPIFKDLNIKGDHVNILGGTNITLTNTTIMFGLFKPIANNLYDLGVLTTNEWANLFVRNIQTAAALVIQAATTINLAPSGNLLINGTAGATGTIGYVRAAGGNGTITVTKGLITAWT